MTPLASLRTETLITRRIAPWLVRLGLVGLGGCGLVLDARAPEDAAVGADARGMDASIPDAAALDAARLDAPENVGSDSFVPVADAPTPRDDAAPELPDAPAEPDAFVVPPPVDAGRDAPIVYPDANLPDAAVARDAGRDASVTAPVDAGRDAATDAPICTSEMQCAPITRGDTCQDTFCAAGMCAATGDSFTCPPAGTCERPCARGATGDAVCVREGMRCSEVFGACDHASMCPSSMACVPLAGCTPNVCVPFCSTGGSCSIVLSDGMTIVGMCSSGRCMPPPGTLPAWCGTP